MQYFNLPNAFSPVRLTAPLLLATLLLDGCTVVSVTSSVVGAGVSVGSAAVGVASAVVVGTVKAGSAVVGAVTE
jgi:hypothetical protein